MDRRLLPALLLLVWLTIVLFTSAFHELWRDEVRALTLATSASTPAELIAAIRYDGHPPLWYAILNGAHALYPSPVVLRVVSIAVAFAAIALFVLRAPLELWLKALFMFGALPLYEYSVEARCYGLSMLLMFLVAWQYERKSSQPYTFALLLVLLANTNFHSLVFTGLFAFMWAWEIIVDDEGLGTDRRLLRFVMPFVLVAAAMVGSLAIVIPPADSILAGAGGRVTEVISGLPWDALVVGNLFDKITPVIAMPQALSGLVALIATLVLYGIVSGLWPSVPALISGLVALLTLAVVFDGSVPGDYRHQGLLIVFWVALYWIVSARTRPWGVGVACLAIVLAWNVMVAVFMISRDVRHPISTVKALSEYLATSETFSDAIIVPEPGYSTEALPYYVDNEIYLPRERRFGKAVMWKKGATPTMSLAELLAIAESVRDETGRPVLIAFTHWEIDEAESITKRYSYNKTISWTAAEREAFFASTRVVGEFRGAVMDEQFRIYAVE